MHALLFVAATFAALLAPFAVAWRWAVAHQVELVGSVVVVVALARAIPADRWARLERDWPRLANLARFLRAIFPDLVKAARTLVAIWTGRPWPAQPPPLDPTAGPVLPRVPPLPLLLCLALLVVGLTGCTPPQLPPIAGCVPRDTRCNEAGIPEVCSGSMRWFHLEGSATCASAGLRCCRNRDQSPQPIYSCVPPSACIPEPESAPTDAGVSDAE